jgi:hypothetical protein
MTTNVHPPRDWYKGIMDSAGSLNEHLRFKTSQAKRPQLVRNAFLFAEAFRAHSGR